jgi:hypothetical protein
VVARVHGGDVDGTYACKLSDYISLLYGGEVSGVMGKHSISFVGCVEDGKARVSRVESTDELIVAG